MYTYTYVYVGYMCVCVCMCVLLSALTNIRKACGFCDASCLLYTGDNLSNSANLSEITEQQQQQNFKRLHYIGNSKTAFIITVPDGL